MTDAPERIWAFGWQDGGTPLAGDWIDERQEAPDCATEYITVAASDARSAHYKRNMREKYDAFTAMRNDINVLIGDMASSVSTLQYGPGMTHECAAVSESVAKYVAASDARIEAAVRAGLEAAALECNRRLKTASYGTGDTPTRVVYDGFLSSIFRALAADPDAVARIAKWVE